MKFNSSNLVAASLIALAAFASSAFALDVTPDYYSFKGKAGAKMRRVLHLKNDSDGEKRLELSFEPRAGEEGGWIEFSEKSFSLKSGGTKNVTVYCLAPQKQGELYGNLLIKCIPLRKNSYEIRMKPEVRLEIEGTQVSEVVLSGISAIQKGRNLSVEAYMKNTGNMKVAPKLTAHLGSQDSEQGMVLSTVKTIYYPNEEGVFTGDFRLTDAASKHQRVFVSAFYRGADGRLAKKTQSFIVEARQ